MDSRDVEAMLPLSPKDFLILFALVEGERHGYGLVKEIERGSKGTVKMDPANLYRSLRRLERDGLVTEVDASEVGEEDERRRYYALSEFGRRVVAAEAERLDRLAQAARRAKLIAGRSEAGR